jgi:predicted MFS family arabinose efflux permease
MPPRHAAAIVAAIWLAGLGAAAQFGKASLLYDDLALRYDGAGPVALGLLVSVVGLVGLVFGTTAGVIAARLGLVRALLAALWLAALVSVLQSALPGYGAMVALRIAEGVTHLAIVVAGPTLIAAVTPPARLGAAMTLWSSFFGVSYAALALVVPPLVAAVGPGAVFLGHALWLAGCAVLLHPLLRGVAPPQAVVPGQAGIWREHLAIYRSPRIAAPATGFVFYTLLYVALLTLYPPLLPAPFGSIAALAMPLLSIAVSLTLGIWLLGRLGPVRLVQGGFAVALLAAPALALAGAAPAVALAAALVLAAALGLVQGASFAAIPALNPEPADRARAAGAIAQLGNVGTTLGTPLLALLVAATGPAAAALFAAPLCAAGIAIHAWQARRRAVPID